MREELERLEAIGNPSTQQVVQLFSKAKTGIAAAPLVFASFILALLFTAILKLMEVNCFLRFLQVSAQLHCQGAPTNFSSFLPNLQSKEYAEYRKTGAAVMTAADRLRVQIDDALRAADSAPTPQTLMADDDVSSPILSSSKKLHQQPSRLDIESGVVARYYLPAANVNVPLPPSDSELYMASRAW